MGTPLRLLLVEDSADDALMLELELRRGGYDVTARRVQTGPEMRAALADQSWDAVISDYTMPDFDMPRALALLRETSLDLPFIIVSGTIDEETAVTAFQSGADDFMTKNKLARLVPALQRAQREAQGRRERRERERELEAIAALTTALRHAETRVQIVAAVLVQMQALVLADGVALGVADPVTGQTVVELGIGQAAQLTGQRLAPGEGALGQVIASGLPQVGSTEAAPASEREVHLAAFRPAAWVGVPLIIHRATVGAVWVGRQKPIGQDELRLLVSIADIAVTALHRAKLYEETQRRLERLTALRTIDLAINASQDMRIVIDVLLAQAVAHLEVDAVALLLANPLTQSLEYAAARGFRTLAVTRTPIRFGEGYAGSAATERRLINIGNLGAPDRRHPRWNELAAEGFRAYYAIPLIAKGTVNGVLEVFHRAPHQADQEWLEFLDTLAGQAAIAINNTGLVQDLQRSNTDLARAYDATIEGWSRALDLRDKATQGHTQRVTELALHLAQVLGLNTPDLVHIRRGALLHDIGKMGIPDSILLKPGPLTEVEWAIMRQHPAYAYKLLAPISHLRAALEIPRYHHERWDGSGYPYQLRQDHIPLAARIFSVVDVWDALRSNRPYRAGWPDEQVQAYIEREAGRSFDPRIVAVFLELDPTRLPVTEN